MVWVGNFLPIFLYDFIGILMEIVYGMGYGVSYWWYGLVMVSRYIHYRRYIVVVPTTSVCYDKPFCERCSYGRSGGLLH